MTHRIVKSFSIILIILLLANLVGCGSTASSKKENVSHQVKTTEVTKDKSEQTAANKTKGQVKAAASAYNQSKTNPGGKAPTKAESKQVDKQSSTAKQNQTNTAKNPLSNTATKSATNTATKSTTNTAAKTSSASKPAGAASTSQSSLKTVKVTIIGPKDKGTLLSKKSVKINAGDTVLDVLLAAAGANNVDYSGSGASAYVRGIDNIYEFDYGQTSGWTYTKNGSMIQKSCGSVTVHAGDHIEWIYKEN